MRISDWSSDVCSSDLSHRLILEVRVKNTEGEPVNPALAEAKAKLHEFMRALARRDARRDHEAEMAAEAARQEALTDRKSGVEGKSVSVRVDLGGRRILKKKKSEKIVSI